MRNHRRTLALASLLVACGGGGESTPSRPNVATTCAIANDGRTVTVLGYLNTPVVAAPCTDTCSVLLSDDPSYSNRIIDVRVPAGTGALTMRPLPTDLEFLQRIGPEHFTVTDSDGTARPVGSRVLVNGTLSARPTRIDRLDGRPPIESLRCSLRPTSLRER